MFLLCGLALAGDRIDLSSPNATVMTYCNAAKKADFSMIRQTFHPNLKLEEKSFKKPAWSECRIVKDSNSTLIGKDLGSGFLVQNGDIEVILEVRMIDPAKGNPKTNFWFLLRNVEGNWKIISNSHVPDKNYPPLD
jgi:hypothetical protein